MSSVPFSSPLIAAVAGVMLLFAAIAAPTIFRVLPPEWSGRYARACLPRYDISLGMAFAMAALFARGIIERVTATICALLLLVSWKVLIPAINRARDQDDDRRFDLIHRASVLTNVGQLAALLWAVLRPG
ncbi:MAG: DUF4149 domain-containing protein [Casimicrobiaceae bacterium]